MKRIAVVFPGQGSQYISMGKEIYENFEYTREIYDQANEILKFDLKKMCFEGTIEELTQTENSQPAIFVTSMAMNKVFLNETGINPVCAAGHSLGEYSALTASGVLDFKDSLALVRKRGMLMKEADRSHTGTMAAVRNIDAEIVREICLSESKEEEIVTIANYNSQNQCVVAGHKNAVKRVVERCEKEKEALITNLNVSSAFHTPLMNSASLKLKTYLNQISYKRFNFPVISNVTGEVYKDISDIPRILSEQIIKPVQWNKTMNYIADMKCNCVIEIGPKKILRNLFKNNLSGISSYSLDNKEDMAELIEKHKNSVINKDIDFVNMCMVEAVSTLNKNDDENEYYQGVIKPYNNLFDFSKELENKSKDLSSSQVKEVFSILCEIFTTKMIPKQEQRERLNSIYEETGYLYKDYINI